MLASPGSTCAGQADVFDPQHVLVFRSQHCTPPARAGQEFAQSSSFEQDGTHFLSAGAVDVGVVDGSFAPASAGNVGDAVVSSAGASALFAQAATTRPVRIAETANADFEKVAYFTGGTLNPAFGKVRPNRLTTPFQMPNSETPPISHPEKRGENASIAGPSDVSETRKKSRKPLLGLLLVLAIGAILFSPALVAPFFLDDHLQSAMVQGTYPAHRSPLNLYDFVDDGDRATLTNRGLLPWWSHPQLKLRFFRPLSSGLLWIDHRVFRHDALPMHLHSLAWWLAAVLAVRALYKRLFSARVTFIATTIFALAPCHALPLAWLANRETLVSLVFGALALSAQARWRDARHVRDAATASAFFVLALLSGGEYALCFGGYVLAMDVGRRESVPRKLTGWLPFLFPAIAYLAVRAALHYGTAGSGFYSDPLRDPGAFLAGAPSRGVALLAIGWLGMDAEPWRVGISRWLLAGIVAAVAAGLVIPVRRMLASLSPAMRSAATWLLVGSVLALVPTLAVVPARRLLGVSMVGISVVVALLLDRAWFPAKGEPMVARGRGPALASLAALGLGFAHLVHGPGTAWLQARKHQFDAADFASRALWIRKRVGDPTTRKIGVVRGMAGAFFAPFAVDPRGRPPGQWCVLAQAGHVLVLRRDLHTVDLVVIPSRSLFPIGERNLYRSEDAPLNVGDEVHVSGLSVTILALGEVGPRSARFVFDGDPSEFVWLTETFDETAEVELPTEGFGEPFDP